MKCPACRTELVKTSKYRAQSLEEHVCNPNGTPSMKQMYGCPNTDCKCNAIIDWTGEGEGVYIKSYADSYKTYRDIKFIDNNETPFESSWGR